MGYLYAFIPVTLEPNFRKDSNNIVGIPKGHRNKNQLFQ